MSNPIDTETDPLATVPAEERDRVLKLARQARGRAAGPQSGADAYCAAIAREVAAAPLPAEVREAMTVAEHVVAAPPTIEERQREGVPRHLAEALDRSVTPSPAAPIRALRGAPIPWGVAVDIAIALCAEGDITQQAATVMRIASRRAELAARPAPAADASLEARAQAAFDVYELQGFPSEKHRRAAVVRAVDASRPAPRTPERAATVIAFLRENFLNDGAEGESVHLACDMLEKALASRPGLTEEQARRWAEKIGDRVVR